jgi:ubiquitin conjugation factor E4 B
MSFSDHLGPEQLVSRLKSESDTPQGLPNEYLTELIQRFSQDGLDTVSCHYFIEKRGSVYS